MASVGDAPMGRKKWTVGIDEVGRGALAGPVVVAVATIPAKFAVRNSKLGPLKDSKKLTPQKREAWVKYFLSDSRITHAIARVYPRQIEKMNISRAANFAALRAFRRLSQDAPISRNADIFLDGGLFLGAPGANPRAKTVVKGDEKITAIMIASVIAKVHRDRLMRRLAKKYPAYGLDIHKGYGTKMHRAALARHGPSSVHRLTFLS